MRPQLGSPPHQLVLTSALLATARAAASASAGRPGAANAHGDKTGDPLAVKHNLFCQLQRHVVQRGLKHGQAGRAGT